MLRDFSPCSQKLVEIAREAGNPHQLDNEEEKNKARDFLLDVERFYAQAPHEPYDYNLALVGRAIDVLLKTPPQTAIQVNPLFTSPETCIECAIPMVTFKPGSDQRFDLLTPLPPGAYMGFYVYTTEPGEGFNRYVVQTQVFIDQPGWEKMISPFTENTGEEEAIASSMALFEAGIGVLAGTSGDRGGWTGNHFIMDKTRPKSDRQQDCNQDAQTAIQFLHRLTLHGLLHDHHLDMQDPVALYMSLHMAAQLRTKSGGKTVVDTWLGDNGEKPLLADIRTREGIEAWQKAMDDTRPGGKK